MSEARVVAGEDGRLLFSGVLSFATVPDAWKRAGALFTASPRVTVDLQGVTHADSAGLALLVECAREARRRRAEIAFVHAPDQLLAIARVNGLDRLLPFDLGAGPPRPSDLEPGAVLPHSIDTQTAGGSPQSPGGEG